MAATEEIAVGVVGCGRSAVFGHLPSMARLPGMFRVAAVCDLEKSRRNRVESMFPCVRHYRRAEDMADDQDLDLVLVATPSLDHDDIVRECLSRKLWTVCETPVSQSLEGAVVLRNASVKAGNRLIAATPRMFSPEFRLASLVRTGSKIGELYDIKLRCGTYCRRSDWQSVSRRGGGAINYLAQECLLQALSLLQAPPVKMWSERKKLVSSGDAEDYARIMLCTAGGVTADIEVNSAVVGVCEPAITLRGTRGSFSVMPGSSAGLCRIVDPCQKFARRRSSVALPPLAEPSDEIRMLEEEVPIPDPVPAAEAFWRAVYATVRGGGRFPVDFTLVAEAARYAGVARKAPMSAF